MPGLNFFLPYKRELKDTCLRIVRILARCDGTCLSDPEIPEVGVE